MISRDLRRATTVIGLGLLAVLAAGCAQDTSVPVVHPTDAAVQTSEAPPAAATEGPSASPAAVPGIVVSATKVSLDEVYAFCIVGVSQITSFSRIGATFPDGSIHTESGWPQTYRPQSCGQALFDHQYSWAAGEYTFQLLVNDVRVDYKITLTQSANLPQPAPLTVMTSPPAARATVPVVATPAAIAPAPTAVVPCATASGFDRSTAKVGEKFSLVVTTAATSATCPQQRFTLVSITRPSGQTDPMQRTSLVGDPSMTISLIWWDYFEAWDSPGTHTYHFTLGTKAIDASITLVR